MLGHRSAYNPGGTERSIVQLLTNPCPPKPAVCAAWRLVIHLVVLDVIDPGSLYIRIGVKIWVLFHVDLWLERTELK